MIDGAEMAAGNRSPILLAARLMRMPSIMTDNQEFAKVVELDRDHNGNGIQFRADGDFERPQLK
jgi:hypothetical protein